MTTPESLVGKQIDQFRVERYIARGAMGMVFQAFDSVLARTVALKVIPKGCDEGWSEIEKVSREESRKRLIQEAKAAGRLSHPNIVTIHCYGENEDLQYICMEYVRGRTLAQILEERKTLPEIEAIPVVMEVLSALQAAGRENIIHRDIKPSNIMLTEDRRVKVMDFGIAKLPSLSMTVTGMVLGTPFYMSPEQISGQRVDIRSDIFSTGAVLYEILTGQKPFPGDTTATLTFKILQVDPVPPIEVNPCISPPMSAITLKALAKDPAERYQSPAEMHDALRQHLERLTVQREHHTATLSATAPFVDAPTALAAPAEARTPERLHREEIVAPHTPDSEAVSRQSPPVQGKPSHKDPSYSLPVDMPKDASALSETEPPEPSPPSHVGKDSHKVQASSRALGIAALLLLVLAAGFILYVTLRPTHQSAPVSIAPPIAQPPSTPPMSEAPSSPPEPSPPTREEAGKSLDALLLEAGKHFVHNPGMAQRLLQEALTIEPHHYESRLMLARLASFQKDYPRAIEHYEAALRVNPQAGEAYFELGSLQVAQGDYAGAVRNLEACLAHMPRNRDDVLTNLGFAYAKLGNTQQANRLFQDALAFNPSNERARALLTGLLPQSGSPTTSGQPKAGPAKIEGKYSVEGTNPNGSTYHGVATIARRDSRWSMTWTIGKQTFSGSGSLAGNTLTVTWKGPTGEGGVVTYTLTPLGVLKGVWANGKGSETLTPLK